MSTRLQKLAVLFFAIVAVSATIVGGALASNETISDFELSGAGRGWDFQNTNTSPFGIRQGEIVLPGHAGDDAFDGGLILSVDGNPFVDSNDSGTYTAKSNSLKVGPDLPNALFPAVSRTETASGPYLRSLIKLHSPNGAPFNGTISWNSDLGSDNAESVQASSSGDKTYKKGDRWVVSSETGANSFDDDPTVAWALFGKGAKEKVDVVVTRPGDGFLDVDFGHIKVPGGSTRYLLFYTELHANPSAAKKSMSKYDKHSLSKGLLKGIGKSTRKSILNWDL